ncbi:MAG: ABC transporter ATP-binding protein [Kiritimatiellae bacterium]|nr:ABC transporter ATP-binding protein [Kiritimatiellia bacterium]
MNELLQVNGLSYRTDETTILEDVSLTVRAGEYLAVIGQNGAGKSTLIKCLAGILEGWTGNVKLEGCDLVALDPHDRARMISYVPQGGVELNPFTVQEFMMLSRYPYYRGGPPADSDRVAVEEALALVEMQAFSKRKMATLSGGERQMIGIAAALAQQPRMILLDEPVTFLDYRHAVRVHQILADARSRCDLAVVSVLHNVHDAGQYADRFLALKAGRGLCEGKASRLMEETALLSDIYDVSFLCLIDSVSRLSFPMVQPSSLHSDESA